MELLLPQASLSPPLYRCVLQSAEEPRRASWAVMTQGCLRCSKSPAVTPCFAQTPKEVPNYFQEPLVICSANTTLADTHRWRPYRTLCFCEMIKFHKVPLWLTGNPRQHVAWLLVLLTHEGQGQGGRQGSGPRTQAASPKKTVLPCMKGAESHLRSIAVVVVVVGGKLKCKSLTTYYDHKITGIK